MRFGFVDEHRDVWPISVMCRVLEVSVSGCYAWRARPESRRSVENRGLLDAIRLVHGLRAAGPTARRASTRCSGPSAVVSAATGWRA